MQATLRVPKPPDRFAGVAILTRGAEQLQSAAVVKRDLPSFKRGMGKLEQRRFALLRTVFYAIGGRKSVSFDFRQSFG